MRRRLARGGAAGHIAMDGKRLRGSATAAAPGAHLLAAFSDALGGVVGQLQVAPDSNEITAQPWACSARCRWRAAWSRVTQSSRRRKSAA